MLNCRQVAKRWAPRIFVGMALCLVWLFYLAAASNGQMEFRATPLENNRWGLWAEGLFAGQTNLMVEPDPRLDQLNNMYDREERDQSKIPYLWDCLYRNGKVYAYWGVVPIIAFHMPYRLVFGEYPPENLAVLIFTILSVVVLWQIFQRIARMMGIADTVGTGVGLLLLSAFATSHSLSLPHAYTQFITAGTFFGYLSWLILLRKGVLSNNWLCISGVMMGLAIGSRFTNIFYAASTGVLVLVYLARAKHNWSKCLWFAAPVLLSLFLIGLHNYLRFDDPLEFGLRYQLGMMDHGAFPFSSVEPGYWAERAAKHVWYCIEPPLAQI